MLEVRRADDRGHSDWGWLNSRHTFSFGNYQDPEHIGFRSLRVINEDRVAAGKGFGEHPHRDMEILSYVLSGQLEHKDSLGNGSVIHAGELQAMSAGTGVTHSEYNPSTTESTHFYQIWLLPNQQGHEPRYQQKRFGTAEQLNRLLLVASPTGESASLSINQDAWLYLSTLDADRSIAHPLQPGRHAWLQVFEGELEVAGQTLRAGDGVAVSDESEITITALSPASLMLFDLP